MSESDHCHPVGFDAPGFLATLEGRRLLFIGDSTHVQLAVALMCALHEANSSSVHEAKLKYLEAKALRKRCGATPLAKCHWENGCV